MSVPGNGVVSRDRLAEKRTALANERTLLAYVRTALALLAAGFSFIGFFNATLIVLIGWALLPIAVFTFARGVLSFRNYRKVIREEGDDGP